MILDAIVPAFNEAPTVGVTVRAILEAQVCRRVLVVDDGSTDGTALAAAMAGAEVLRLPANGGKGAAIFAGLERVDAEAIVLLDADAVALDGSHVRLMVERFGLGFDQVCGVQDHGPLRNWTLSMCRLLTGQRVLRRWVLDAAPRSCRRYQIEVALNFAIERHGGASDVLILPGARFRSKSHKFGFMGGWLEYMRMMRDVRQGESELSQLGECQL